MLQITVIIDGSGYTSRSNVLKEMIAAFAEDPKTLEFLSMYDGQIFDNQAIFDYCWKYHLQRLKEQLERQ